MRGKIKFYNTKKAFGFVIPDPPLPDGKELYFSRASLPRDRRFDPVEGDAVQFDIRQSPQGPMAVRIELESAQP